MDIKTYRRKSNGEIVEAVQFTEENFVELAKWCFSTVSVYRPDAHHKSGDYRDGQICIEVTTSRYQGNARKTRAYVDSWIARLDGKREGISLFRVYRENFLELFEEIDAVAAKREAVMKLVDTALTVSGPDHTALVQLFTNKIMDIFK